MTMPTPSRRRWFQFGLRKNYSIRYYGSDTCYFLENPMRSRLIATLLLAIAGVGMGNRIAQAFDDDDFRELPELATASAVDQDTIEIQRTQTEDAIFKETTTDSKGVKTTKDVVRSITGIQTTKVKVSTIEVRRIDGSMVNRKEFSEQLAKPKELVVMFSSRKYDERYLKLFKPDTLVLRIKSSRIP